MTDLFGERHRMPDMTLASVPPRPPPPGGLWGRLVPWAVFAALAGVSVLVWNHQVGQQRALLGQHTDTVGLQAARRLEIFVQARMTMAQIVALRWSSHEGEDFSKARFVAFSRILIQATSGFRVLRLLSEDGSVRFTVPQTAPGSMSLPATEARRLVQAARQTGQIAMTNHVSRGGAPKLVAFLPLMRGERTLGFLVAELHIPSLLDDCFHNRIREEFRFRLKLGDQELYRHPLGGEDPAHGIRSSHDVHLGDQRWTLEMVLRRSRDVGHDAPGNLLVLGLGLLLSAGLGLTTRQLNRRMGAFRRARDGAVEELRERKRAQGALRAAEAGYRSVFNAATDGILVLDDLGMVKEANPAAGDMLGLVGGALVGVDVRTLLPADQTHIYDAFRRQIRRQGRARLDAVVVREDGTTFDVEIRGTTYRHGDERRILALLTDVSDRKRAERKLAQLSHSVLKAQEAERARVARDLHDELGQIITALRLELGVLQKRYLRGDKEGAESWRGATTLLEAAAKELRRVCQGLRPPLLDDLGLGPAVEQMVERYGEHSGLEMSLDLRLVEPDPALVPEVALSAYRILQESLTNVGRHSGANRVQISLVRESAGLLLSVYDNGKGFDAEALGSEGAGITGMSERAHLVGGHLEIRSMPAQGTRVTFRAALEPMKLPIVVSEPADQREHDNNAEDAKLAEDAKRASLPEETTS